MRFIFSRKLTRGSFPCTGQYRHSFVRSVAPGRTDRVSLARRERWMIKSEVRENSLRPALTPPRYWSDAAAWPSGENVDRERHMQSVACFVLTGAGCLSNRVGWLEPARLYRYLDQIKSSYRKLRRSDGDNERRKHLSYFGCYDLVSLVIPFPCSYTEF